MSGRLLRIAVVYWVIAVAWGIYMGASGDHGDMPVHAHLNLLGWVSLALCGLIYAVAPHLADTLLAKAHFWLHNLGLPPLMLGVLLIYRGHPEIGGPIAGIFSIVVGLAVLSFAVNLWRGGFPKAS
jgi:cbb3-type cytochrome oxidase subunit 1